MKDESLINFIEAKTSSIKSLDYVWKESIKKIDDQLKLMVNTMDSVKHKRIKNICINQLYTNILKKIIDYEKIIPPDWDELKSFEESLYKDVMPQVPIFINTLLKDFLFGLNYIPGNFDNPTNLQKFNCLNLDLRDLVRMKIQSREPLKVIGNLKSHEYRWYFDHFHDLNQFHFAMPESYRPLRNEAIHEADDSEQANYDHITTARVPANSIILSNIGIHLIYFTMEILNTWIITWVQLGIIEV